MKTNIIQGKKRKVKQILEVKVKHLEDRSKTLWAYKAIFLKKKEKQIRWKDRKSK